jgi:hypothetical protein
MRQDPLSIADPTSFNSASYLERNAIDRLIRANRNNPKAKC